MKNKFLKTWAMLPDYASKNENKKIAKLKDTKTHTTHILTSDVPNHHVSFKFHPPVTPLTDMMETREQTQANCSFHDEQAGILDINGLMQERRNSSALAMELCLFCANLSIYNIMIAQF